MDSLKWRLPKCNKTKYFNTFALIMFIGSIVYAIIIYPNLPEEIPVHFNLQGEADGWGGKGSIFMFPLFLGPTLILSYVIGKYAHFLHFGDLTDQDKQMYIDLSKNIAMINAVLGLTLVYSIWMVKQRAASMPAFEPWSFYLLIGAIILLTVRITVQSIRRKKAGKQN